MWPDICQPPQLIAHVCFAHLGPAILPFSSSFEHIRPVTAPEEHLFFTSGSAPRSLHGLLLHVIQGSQVLKVTSYTDHPHSKWPRPQHYYYFTSFISFVLYHSLKSSSIYVFTAYLLPLKYKFHELRTLLCTMFAVISRTPRTEPGWQANAGSGNESITPVCQEVEVGREMVKMGIV